MSQIVLPMFAISSLVLILAVGMRWAPRTAAVATRVLAAGFIALTSAIVVRWVLTGHPPIFGTFENCMAATWFIVAFVLADSYGPWRGYLPGRTGTVLLTWIVPFLGFSIFFDPQLYPLTISERSLWVDSHVLLAWVAHTVMLAIASAAILVVSGDSSDDDRAAFDAFMFKGTGIGLAFLTLMIGAGAVYSYLLFSEWIRWEIVEVFAVAAWLAYSSVMHAIMFFGWKDKRLAYLVLASTLLMLGTYWVWSVYSGTYHHFEIPSLKAR